MGTSFREIHYLIISLTSLHKGAHALNVACIELMSIPASGDDVGNAVIDVICKSNSSTNPEITLDVGSWINAVALIMTSLPDPYLQVSSGI